MLDACIIQIDNKCHQPKKGKFICKHCWGVASPSELEKVKQYDNSYCKNPGCFEWNTEEGGFCVEHKQIREVSADIKKGTAKVATAIRAKSEDIVEKGGRTRSRSPTTAADASAASSSGTSSASPIPTPP